MTRLTFQPSVGEIKDLRQKIDKFNDNPRTDSLEINYPAIKNAEKGLKKLFETFPRHESLDEIYLKVVAINGLYSTNIYDTYRIAYHIFNNVENIDNRLVEGDPKLVNDIAKGHGIRSKGKAEDKYFYSFATKYCSFHNPEKYAIYDTLIQDLLIKLHNRDIVNTKEEKIGYKILREDYRKFLEKIEEFKGRYKLDGVTLKDIDMYLWIKGKEIEAEKIAKKLQL